MFVFLVFPVGLVMLVEWLAPYSARAEAPAPRLVVLLTVDQLGRDKLDPALPGGLGRLAREGRVFSEGSLAHSLAETCPGHAALSTGRHPGRAGLPSNYTVDRESGTVEYCLEDDPDASGVLGIQGPSGRSPRRMRVDALGDWLQQERSGALVLSVSGKDRAAIALGGQHPTGAYWLVGRREGRLGFTTSRYYAPELPSWVRDWNGWGTEDSAGLLARVPEQWAHRPEAAKRVDPKRPDAYGAESAEFIERESVHRLRGEQMQETVARIYRSPFLDALTLDFAAAAARELGLGSDDVPDLLAVSLSATDTVGHEFGPESHEAADALLRLDGWLGNWLSALEARVGRGRVLVALSSDHGVMPIPEWLSETGRSRCPVKPGRVSLDAMRGELQRHLHVELGGMLSWPRVWLYHAGLQLTVNRSNAAEAKVPVERVVTTAEAWLEARPEVAAAWTTTELADSAHPMAQRYRRSHDPERSGDLAVQVEPDCLVSRYTAGTSHGTPYDYDSAVPIVFWGAGIRPGRDARSADTVDVAPTLARLLGIELPADLDGVSLVD